jgi:hypothetical protein
MQHRACQAFVAAAVAVCGASAELRAADGVTHPYPGITHIRRTDAMTSPTRQVRMNIVLIDLTAPEVRFKMTPPGVDLPLPLFPTPGWPLPPPPFETVRRSTLGFLEDSHAQVAIDTHFFAPFPVPAGSTQGAYAYLIGLAASRGNVYSAFESPFQNYALVRDSPAINIDRENRASVVHRDPAFADGKHVLEDVTLWNAFAGSAQIVTNGVKSLPFYVDATHPDGQLIPPGPANYSNNNSWYNLVNARTAIGLTEDNQTLVLFTVDVRPTTGPDRSNGMRVGEVAEVLINDYGVYNALNMDGGGSTTMAMQDPADPDHVRTVINTPSDNPPRAEGANFAVYSDGLDPNSTAVVSPAPNAGGWNNTNVTVRLDATDLRSGIEHDPVGWVDQIQYSLAGAQTGGPHVATGHTASINLTTEGITTVTYFATDAAGNEEAANTLRVRLDRTAPVISGLPASGCTLWPPDDQMHQVGVVSAVDALSGVAPGSLQVAVTSSEPSDPGNPDALVTSDGSGGFVVALRAERLGSGPGRLYTITTTARDRADNVQTATTTCFVPHDRRSP